MVFSKISIKMKGLPKNIMIFYKLGAIFYRVYSILPQLGSKIIK
jgi:hypothetical protein